MVRALHIHPSGECRVIDIPASGSDGALECRQSAVDGYIEPVDLDPAAWNASTSEPAFLWINGEGKYRSGPDDYNGLATDLARSQLFLGDWIVGPVLVVGDGEGSDCDVPEWVIDRVRRFPDAKFSDTQSSGP